MQARFKRFTALILSVLMVLTCMPLSAMAEDAAIPAEDISVEVIPEDAEAVPEQEAATVMDAEASEPEGDPVSETVQETEVLANQAPAEETPSAPETVPETETPQEEVPQEESAMQSEETQPAEAAEEPMRLLEMAIARANKPKLFGANSFPEAEKFAALKTIKSSGEYNHFFNVCSKCFVESIENYGKDQGNENYFRNDIKASYPALFEVLRRIKIYRHHEDHLELKKAVSKDFSLIWNEDTEGVTDPQEQLFVVQQRILDGLISAIQIEIDSLE